MPIVTVPGHGTILFVHIPKTGGTSIELYFMSKGVPDKQLLTTEKWVPTHKVWVRGVSLQHQRFQEIAAHAAASGIDITPLRKFAVVRNPYSRVISDLFFYRKITPRHSPAEVFRELKKYIDDYLRQPTAYDNHARPQSDLILDEQGQIDPSLCIMRCETLTADMRAYGFKDFNIVAQQNQYKLGESQYMNLLNKDSISLINTVYAVDFNNFGYPMI